MKHLILDCGGVLVYPRLGDWKLPFGAAAILGERARDLHTARYLLAQRQSESWLDEARPVKDVAEERGLRLEYIRAMDVRMDWHLTLDEIDRLADDFTYNIQRYGFFDDDEPWLQRWKGEGYRLGILSDAMPSILVFMAQRGLLHLFDAAVISTHVGAIKPDPRMYAAILEALKADPADCLFVDDRAENLEGARKAGMRAAQMARSEALPARIWEGPVVRNFEELNALMESEAPR